MRIDLGRPMTLEEIALATGGSHPHQNAVIRSITTDSREAKRGDLFIAIKGDKFDGANFASEVKKTRGFVLSNNPLYSDILHQNSNDALLSLANHYIKTLPYILYKIGITGSVGKTTTKEFLKALVSQRYKTHASEGNFNSQIGMPMSVLSAAEDTQVLIMEMGMNHPGEIARLSRCLMPDISIITNIGTAHIGNLGSRENIAKAKLEITIGMNNGKLFIPADEPLLSQEKNTVRFSLTDNSADCFIKQKANGSISVYKSGALYTNANYCIPGKNNLKCLLPAVSVAIELGITPAELSKRISTIAEDFTRQKLICRENLYFYTDFYNASRESVLSFVAEAYETKTDGKKSLLLGDILELGSMSNDIHYEIGKEISHSTFSNLFLFGNYTSFVRLGAIEGGFPPDRIFVNTDTSDPLLSAMQIRQNCNAGDMIFMKASRGLRLERILDCFTQ